MLVVVVDLGVLSVTDNGLGRQSIVGGGSVYPFVQNILLAARNDHCHARSLASTPGTRCWRPCLFFRSTREEQETGDADRNRGDDGDDDVAPLAAAVSGIGLHRQ